MTEENEQETEDKQGVSSGKSDTKERSSIAFPYKGLGDAITVADAIHNNVGLGDCSTDQLAPWLNLSPKSSGFRIRLSSSKMFGLIGGDSSGGYSLTDLGRKIVDPDQAVEARIDAFLNVPLYSAIFEQYKGGVLPPPSALEQDMNGLGVAKKQASRARQVLEKSAELAGFFKHGKNKLVRPGIAPTGQPSPPKPPAKGPRSGTGIGTYDPLIEGLLSRLPEVGDEWPVREQVRWLRALAFNLSVMFNTEDEIEIGVRQPMTSEQD